MASPTPHSSKGGATWQLRSGHDTTILHRLLPKAVLPSPLSVRLDDLMEEGGGGRDPLNLSYTHPTSPHRKEESMTKIYSPREIRAISSKGKPLFAKLDRELKEKYYGKFVAIEVDSGEYFMGERGIDASRKAREKYPDTMCYVGRIGYRAAITSHGHVPMQWGHR